MPTFTRSILIRVPIQALYDFHLDTNNVKLVQPPGFSVEKVELPPEIKVGAQIRLTVRLFGLIPQHWLVAWAQIEPPQGNPLQARLTDEMLEGPFPKFRQERIFAREGDATRLTDHVIFEPPFGFIGRLFLPAIHLQFAGMFWWRQRRTRVLLEERSCH
jgi:ligand-binding SRPBCC domain-containing protein